ncbi:MAG TPA: low temperature requirement protein A [Acidimicrobiales bacterium]|nr:low temperature requirement protein A [Acidimicrobiales bacterium]
MVSPLELLFDLTFVVAVASVTAQLAHGIAEGHAVDGIVPFLQVFFAIWWAWMNFTWFASSFDTDDVPYRLLTLLQMAGVLVLAVGVPAATDGDFRIVTIGYLVMRVGLVALWVRAGREDPASRATARRYALAIAVAEVGWIARQGLDEAGFLPGGAALPVFLTLVGLELAIPPWAERPRPTTWHPHHIAERYGLFAIILLGEGVLAASLGMERMLAGDLLDGSVITVAIAGLVLVFALWWLYFLDPCGPALADRRDRSYRWGYGHYGVFASLAALGGGLEVAIQHPAHEAAISPVVVSYAVAIPVAAFLVLLWAVNTAVLSSLVVRPALTATAALVILLLPGMAPVAGSATVIGAIAAVVASLVATTLLPPGPRTSSLGLRRGHTRVPRRPTRDCLGVPTEATAPAAGARSSCHPVPRFDRKRAEPMHDHILEPAAQEIADATSKPPFLYELGPEGARKVLDDIQAAPIAKPDIDETWITVPAEVGDVPVRIVKPVGATGPLPAVLYVHGGGWVLGNAMTHDRLVRELAVGTNAAIVFVEYDRSPEAHYPVAIEQAYATARWILHQGHTQGLDASRLAVAGDSVGGNMAAALTLLAKQRGEVTFVHQSLYYPVTDAAQDTDSYREFADGPFLTAKGMAWFWDAYLPDHDKRFAITASPLRASLDELAGLPEAFVIVDENDVLRDEGEAYARKLTEAGVRTTSVRFNGIIHDFMMLNPVRGTAATTAALEQAIHILRKALGTQ